MALGGNRVDSRLRQVEQKRARVKLALSHVRGAVMNPAAWPTELTPVEHAGGSRAGHCNDAVRRVSGADVGVSGTTNTSITIPEILDNTRVICMPSLLGQLALETVELTAW